MVVKISVGGNKIFYLEIQLWEHRECSECRHHQIHSRVIDTQDFLLPKKLCTGCGQTKIQPTNKAESLGAFLKKNK